MASHTMMGPRLLLWMLAVVWPLVDRVAIAQSEPSSAPIGADESWDYSPYRVLVWVAASDPTIDLTRLESRLRQLLDRDFSSIWRVDFTAAPANVGALALRAPESLTYDSIIASDLVLAVRRDHPEAHRIRAARDVTDLCPKVTTSRRTMDRWAEQEASRDPRLARLRSMVEVVEIDGGPAERWLALPNRQALLMSRGTADSLTDPLAKLVEIPASDSLAKTLDRYDKLFVVSITSEQREYGVRVVELDILMRQPGPMVKETSVPFASLPRAVARGLTSAFSPTLRIDDAGLGNAVGILRAGGLILRPDSPAAVGPGDVLEPMLRKDDRNGDPAVIGPLEWSFLTVLEVDGRYLDMNLVSGRPTLLRGRRSARTHRRAQKVHPTFDATTIRLHRRNDPDYPLVGYEFYQRDPESREMKLIGSTDWDGRIKIAKDDQILRLLYVKNGGAVLARLPVVPGLQAELTAGLRDDEVRLEAEAYVTGVQNSIISLVGKRRLYEARIRRHLKLGEPKRAKALMDELRQQPSSDAISNELSRRQIDYLNRLGSDRASESRRIDEMFGKTRELLAEFVNDELLNKLETELIAAQDTDGQPQASDVSNESTGT